MFASSRLEQVPGEPHGSVLNPTMENAGFGLYLLGNTKHTVDRWYGPQMDLQPNEHDEGTILIHLNSE
eukprot:CAMPEP_0119118432 /NCGR_PEP_ID=MMETSP1310-20130426/318_1 /TAXON_ID=464262 /ORGANISM="Genus nov. species nov., Strain RCC2339" /LENGTH=67 /DNA_ID=CAMNT_0007107797 /DNA_START=679 /DNA_END=882 /DNA_ORIENTATION=+